MNLHSEYSREHPFWGNNLVKTDVMCYRGCGEIVKVEHLPGDRIIRWHECWACKKKAPHGSFDRSGATI